MKISMQQGKGPGDLHFSQWDIAIVGETLDDRGVAAVEFAKQNAKEVRQMTFSHAEFQFKLGTSIYDIDNAEEAFHEFTDSKVLIESTTLGFVEVLLICDALYKAKGRGVSITYIEPKNYKREMRNLLLNKRDFSLSGEVPGYSAIPGYSLISLEHLTQKVIFFTGYESSRLEKALEDNSWILSKNTSLVFGVPAFNPGWEMNSFTNNMRVISERNLSGGTYFAAATNPLAAYQIVDDIFAGLGENEQLFVAPIGTKPQAIGIALFAIQKPGVGILYDHPIKKKQRTGSISNWHLYYVNFPS